ncbi:ribosomal protein L27 [Colletotrichum asianum]
MRPAVQKTHAPRTPTTTTNGHPYRYRTPLTQPEKYPQAISLGKLQGPAKFAIAEPANPSDDEWAARPRNTPHASTPNAAALEGRCRRSSPADGPPHPAALPANALVAGRRYASVKSQGAYKLQPKRTIPKKLGAKRTGDQYVIPGNIIYKQRGSLWWPGENCIMGRDHTIHAMASGYVKYYRDPARHPDRKYIGVVFNKDDVLPYPTHAERKRKLNMAAHPISKPVETPAVSASGIPTQIVRAAPRTTKGVATQPPRVLKLRDDYSYREDNWRIGRLVKLKTGGMSRKARFRHKRWAKEKMMTGQRAAAAKFADMEIDEWTIAASKRLQEQRNAASRAKNVKAKQKAAKKAAKAQKAKR